MIDQNNVDHRVFVLHNLFLPHVTPIVEKKIREFFKTANFSPAEIADLLRKIKEEVTARGGTPDEVKAAVKLMRITIRRLQNVTEEEKASAIEFACDRATEGVITPWMFALVTAAPGGLKDERTLDLTTLDEAMLPPLDDGTRFFFSLYLSQTELEFDEARAVLVAVRAALPAGKIIPDEAASLLLEQNITVDDGTDS